MEPKELQAMNSIARAAGIQQPQQSIHAQLAGVMNGLQQMNNALIQLMQQQQQLGIYLDVTRLTSRAFIDTMINKGILTLEEWETIYKEKVSDVMNKMLSNVNKPEEQEQEHCECDTCAENSDNTDSNQNTESEECESDVTLASEKSDTINFG